MNLWVWIILSFVVLINLKAYLCTKLFRWNDKRNNTNASTIAAKIATKIAGDTTGNNLSSPLMEFMKSYTSSFVQIYGYYCSYLPSQILRRFIYKRILGCSIGKNSGLHYGVKMVMPHRIAIGENCIIGEQCYLDGRMFMQIGNNVNMSTGVTIWTLQHDPYSPSFSITGGTVIVEDNVWISFRSTVLPGVTVRKNCVVGAHSLVTKSTAEAGVYFGIPAKEIKKRDIEIEYKLKPVGYFI